MNKKEDKFHPAENADAPQFRNHLTIQNSSSKYARERFQLKETIVTISAEERHIPVAKRAIRSCRRDLESFIRRDPFFRVTLIPVPGWCAAYRAADDIG